MKTEQEPQNIFPEQFALKLAEILIVVVIGIILSALLSGWVLE